jgi:hypothetical protein
MTTATKELLHRKMKFRQFDLTALPMSQGLAAKGIAQSVGAYRILAVGDNMGERFTDEDDAGGLLYVRLGWNAGDKNMVEVVFLDNGCGVKCWFRREYVKNVPGAWEYNDPSNEEANWVPTDFAVTGITVEDYNQD